MHPFAKCAVITFVSAVIFVLNSAVFWSSEIRFLIASAVAGAFVGIIALPEFEKRVRKGADLRNAIAGIAAGAAIAALLGMPLLWAGGVVCAGAVLGYLGLKWVRHLQLP